MLENILDIHVLSYRLERRCYQANAYAYQPKGLFNVPLRENVKKGEVKLKPGLAWLESGCVQSEAKAWPLPTRSH